MIPSLPKLLGLIAIIWVVWTVFRIYETRQAAIRAQQTKDGDGHAMMHRMTRLDEIGLTPIIRLTCANVKSVGRGSVERIVGGKTALLRRVRLAFHWHLRLGCGDGFET